MEKIVIHIGYHKSASTFLQRLFPQWPVNYAFVAGPDRQILDMIQGRGQFEPAVVRAWLAETVGQSRHAVTVLSHEELSGHPHGYSLVSPAKVAANLKELFPSARILIVVRNQLDYVLSLYAFRVAIKGMESRSFARFVKDEAGLGLLNHLQFDRLVEIYQSLFGAENVLVVPMERLRRDPQAFFAPIMNLLEVDAAPPAEQSSVNESTRNLALLQMLRPINKAFSILLSWLRAIFRTRAAHLPDRFRFWFYGLRAKFSRRMTLWFPGGQKLAWPQSPEFDSIAAQWAESNLRLEKQTDLDLAALGYPLPGSPTRT